MGEDLLRQKIIDIICEEWPTPDGYLLGFDVYERLRSQGVEVTHHTVTTVLSGLATSGRITLTMAAGDGTLPAVRYSMT
jgi:Fe2+ or Zn2+ uptake regulation protein